MGNVPTARNFFKVRGLTIFAKDAILWPVSNSIGLAGVVQLVECLLAKEKVVGSSPIARSLIYKQR